MNLDYADEVRAIEQAHQDIHHALIEWGLWGRAQKTRDIEPPGIWRLPGKYSQELDEEAAPESPPPPINLKRVRELDEKINYDDFPAMWRRVLKANYVMQIPEAQRPAEARVSTTHYLSALEMACEKLG